jgi:hypothetical protein
MKLSKKETLYWLVDIIENLQHVITLVTLELVFYWDNTWKYPLLLQVLALNKSNWSNTIRWVGNLHLWKKTCSKGQIKLKKYNKVGREPTLTEKNLLQT